MTIKHWPASERPREKLLQLGCKSLSDAELLAIFLRTGIAGKTAVDLARDLLLSFGSLRNLLTCNLDEFTQHKGLGSAKYAQLQAVVEMSRRHLGESMVKSDILKDPDATKQFLHAKLRDYDHEVFAALYLDSQHHVIYFEELFHGSIASATVYPREVVKNALKHNAATIIFAHNHPSGVAEPSHADQQITQKLKSALSLVDIQVLDHIIVGDSECTSFAERGLL
ncbi:MAG: DNA repair protein RadC [Gammaproteobacteria bacterium]